MSAWRVKHMCANCPFSKSAEGTHLRKSLNKCRWNEILRSLRRGENFLCHKTTDETGNGTNLVCAGAIDYQHKHGLTSQYERIAERLEYFAKLRETKA